MRVETEDLRRQAERDVEARLGYNIDVPVWHTAATWGAMAFGILMLGELLSGMYSAFDSSYPTRLSSELPKHLGGAVFVVAGTGYFYARQRARKWHEMFSTRLEELQRF